MKILWTLLQPVLGAVIKQIADSIADYLREQRRIEAERALAVAKEQARAAAELSRATARMGTQALPDDAEVMERLKKGTA